MIRDTGVLGEAIVVFELYERQSNVRAQVCVHVRSAFVDSIGDESGNFGDVRDRPVSRADDAERQSTDRLDILGLLAQPEARLGSKRITVFRF